MKKFGDDDGEQVHMRRFTLLVLLIAAMIALTACGGGEESPDPANDGGGDTTTDTQSVVQWPRDPQHIIFRAEIIGGDGSDALYDLNTVPPCTIYGDGRIVWTVPNQSGFEDVRFDLRRENKERREIEKEVKKK